MSNSARFLDLHVIQSVPPSCVNRGEDGRPKTSPYGGVDRLRISSQAWKRATRVLMSGDCADRALRTRELVEVIGSRLAATHVAQPEVIRAVAAAAAAAIVGTSNSGKTVPTLLGGRAIQQAVDTLVASMSDLSQAFEAASDPKKQQAGVDKLVADLGLYQIFVQDHDPDVALYGRMVATNPGLGVDAAVQVAHSISTHMAQVETDYFTAVDDWVQGQDDRSPAAGMIGDIDFSSGTMYRYANVSLQQLAHNLGDDSAAAAEVAGRFVDAYCRSIPTGHITGFAHQTLPALVLVVAREDRPISYVEAFERPVSADEHHGGYITPSIAALLQYHHSVDGSFGPAGDIVGVLSTQPLPQDRPLHPQVPTLQQLCTRVVAQAAPPQL